MIRRVRRSRGPFTQVRLARLAALVPARSSTAARTPFVLLLVVLLGAGMLGLLFLNASLNQGSFELSELRSETRELTDEQQELQAEVDAYAAPDALAERARELGLVPGGPPAFISPDGSVLGDTEPAPEPTQETREPEGGDDAEAPRDPIAPQLGEGSSGPPRAGDTPPAPSGTPTEPSGTAHEPERGDQHGQHGQSERGGTGPATPPATPLRPPPATGPARPVPAPPSVPGEAS
ncbi:FtsB family cell division protein [Streptomyces litchfieldiae]|uniref:Septum formation initiator family protein n=1 Tax=Streptomyces litchfieldiae TaxID=3075543 RepID=A0ABU2MYC4_9ACTN|nr:septum formation initiator family protein [Streptomyces sp. DSM 44938]MDT0346525.1 septum formation initiator family protein [Streptomyces sp. DSM 44938]